MRFVPLIDIGLRKTAGDEIPIDGEDESISYREIN